MLRELGEGEVSQWVKKINRSERTWLEMEKPIEKWLAPTSVWFLLSEVSRFLIDVVDYYFLLHYYEFLTNRSKDKANDEEIVVEDVDNGG
ncbi:binding protein [Artemisia annua]|uniref:Binding protein n=1 Tax=Artemisia annua TaxID=35608 RepID=A0A2U1LIJ3_ARTAN|nr:binding protein [Artemisia annua]